LPSSRYSPPQIAHRDSAGSTLPPASVADRMPAVARLWPQIRRRQKSSPYRGFWIRKLRPATATATVLVQRNATQTGCSPQKSSAHSARPATEILWDGQTRPASTPVQSKRKITPEQRSRPKAGRSKAASQRHGEIPAEPFFLELVLSETWRMRPPFCGVLTWPIWSKLPKPHFVVHCHRSVWANRGNLSNPMGLSRSLLRQVKSFQASAVD
jgi:hypothetical protein